MINRDQFGVDGIGRKEYLLYSLMIDFGSKVMTDEELGKLINMYLDIVRKGPRMSPRSMRSEMDREDG